MKKRYQLWIPKGGKGGNKGVKGRGKDGKGGKGGKGWDKGWVRENLDDLIVEKMMLVIRWEAMGIGNVGLGNVYVLVVIRGSGGRRNFRKCAVTYYRNLSPLSRIVAFALSRGSPDIPAPSPSSSSTFSSGSPRSSSPRSCPSGFRSSLSGCCSP